MINLWPSAVYVFNSNFEFPDGGTALPVIDQINENLTLNGNGATFLRPAGAPSFRFIRAIGEVDVTKITPLGRQPIGPTLVLNNMVFRGGNTFDLRARNRADGGFPLLDGGAVRTDNADLIATDVTFENNTSADGGGAVAIDGVIGFAGRSVLTRTRFINNYAGKAGGGLLVAQVDSGSSISSNAIINDSVFNGNISLTGAGAAEGATTELILNRTQVINNQGEVGGVSAAITTATDTVFQSNVARGAGPAAVIATGNMLTLVNSTITQNSSASGGSVVGQGQGRAVELIGTTVHNNSGGGAAVQAPNGEAVITFSTITNNRATTGDVAGATSDTNILTIFGSVIAGNRVTDPLSPNVDVKANQIRNDGFNLIGVAPASYPRLPGDLFGTPGNELDPRMAVLGNYGGPVPTRPPAAGSPLLNAAGIPLASRLVLDARGQPRVVAGAADIGAVEVPPTDSIGAAEPPLPPLNPLPPPPPPPGPPPSPPPPPKGTPLIAVGPGPGSQPATTDPNALRLLLASGGRPLTGTTTAGTIGPNEARLYTATGQVALAVTPFAAAVPGGIRVASADMNGDGVEDLIAATGPGVSNLINVFDGKTGTLLTSMAPFEASFQGGLFVTTGDLTGDGRPDLVVTPDNGGGPRVMVLTGAGLSLVANFFGIDDSAFRGGARSAVGDLNNDGVDDLIVAAGTGGGPRLSIFDGTSNVGGVFTTKLLPDFFLMDEGLRNGLFVASGDVNGDGFDDLVVGAGPDGGPRVLVLSGRELIQQNGLQVPLADFFSGDPSRRDGVPVTATDLDGDGLADVAAGGGATGTVTVYVGKNLKPNVTITPDAAINPFPEFAAVGGGVYVG